MSGPHLDRLNPNQTEAVKNVSGPLLVLAGAGTGKTRVVTCRIAEILSRGISPSSICAVTFTNKAAREMLERAKKLLAKRDIKGMVVSTFHSLGLKILREFGERIGIASKANIADEGDQISLLTDVMREAGVGRHVVSPKDARWKISMWKNAGLFPDQARGAADVGVELAIAHAYERYQEALQRRALLDFDDLILMTLKLLEEADDVLTRLQDRWRYLLVDEYQDTNACQYRLVKLLAGERRNVCVVGDDDQSIYGWRGADPERILRFTRDFPGSAVVTLEQNYRSTSNILEIANELICINTRRRPKKLWSAAGAGQEVELYVAEDEKDETDFVAGQIKHLRDAHDLRFEDCAVLFRANTQCRPLEQALRGRQIPYRVVGTRSFFDRREVRDLLAYVRLARNSDDDNAFLRVVNTPARGLGKGSLEKLSHLAAKDRTGLYTALERHSGELPTRAQSGADDLKGHIEAMRSAVDMVTALETLIEKSQYRDHLRMITEDPLEVDQRLAAVDDLVSTAIAAQGSGARTLADFLDALSLRTEDSRHGDRDREQAGVTLLTMHAAKGLEYGVVFIVGLEEGILPHQRSLSEEEIEDRPLEEERRLLYVGITRARRQLFLSRANTRNRFGRSEKRRPSRFLGEIGEHRFKVLDGKDDTPASQEDGTAWLKAIKAKLQNAAGLEDGDRWQQGKA